MLQAILIIVGCIVVILGALWLIGFRVIPNNRVAVVEKWWSRSGSLDEKIIALNKEAGFQPYVLRGGVHFLTPLMYRVHICPLVTVPQGEIAYVFARDGEPLPETQTLGRVVDACNNFQDVIGFINHGGQKGIQRSIIREGTYAFNLAQFVIITKEHIYSLPLEKSDAATIQKMADKIHERQGFTPIIIKGVDDMLGIVTVHDGPSLSQDHIVAPTVGDDSMQTATYHNNFQDITKFLAAGGYRGRQYQVLTEGTYFINRMFATIELIDKTVIPVGSVGVVISYIGEHGEDASGEEYKHGELVKKGFRGVWKDPLTPGKYAFNTYAGKIVEVPTTNIILKWISNEGGEHLFDSNLKEVNLITKDAFEPSLPLSVVLHIDYRKAPFVIQRFGDIKMLVDQTLDPMVSAYFKNIGQSKTLIELLQERSEIQDMAATQMKVKFQHYNIELEEVLIGTPSSSKKDNKIEIILDQLRDRQVAMEQIETYNQQQKAAVKERELKEAQSKAEQQKALTQSEINIEVQDNAGKAAYQRSLHDAEKIKALAIAESEKEAKMGIGKAIAIHEQVKAYGGPKYQVLQDIVTKYTAAIENGSIQVVPNTLVNMGGEGSGNINPLEAFITLLLAKEFDDDHHDSDNRNMSADLQAFKEQLLHKESHKETHENKMKGKQQAREKTK
ncbi:flotillin family protein [Vallitalea pronyensis]|uniref:Flotillin family protein n=1 Tax=Vallitalea pronyensis TaxID=1348613 RepID=A0A8J8MPF2_9FIRM|nr:SPFH domain-containing protein [Vallitalea pronyensis]QUI25209.1 flotillin family protein [Vallitalea pronyensis]